MDAIEQQGFAQPQSGNTRLQFEFKGSGSEYFRIWIVNLLLSIITLGIYSAWAKVRRNKYLYSNTHLGGSSFEYHGNPIAILKGRIVATVFFVAYNISFKTNVMIGFAMLILLMAVMPWLVWKSLQFKLYNSSYRGIRFGFQGSASKAYMTFLVRPFLNGFTLGLATPYVHQRLKKFQHSESRFGGTSFSFDGKVSQFYMAYLKGIGILLLGVLIIGILATVTLGGGIASILAARNGAGGSAPHLGQLFAGSVLVFIMYLWMFSVYPIFLTLIQNLIWSHTKLGQHQISSTMAWNRMTFIAVTNLFGIVFTLGLFTPFAQIRALRYRVESLDIDVAGGLDHFIADTQEQVSATGEGMADLLDFDLSL